jgi:carbonic anhydrase
VTILSCSDSRVPPELVFDRGIGDLFVIRVAGNVVDKDEIATAEYGCGHLNTSVLMVMGHTKCGAVAACVGNAQVHGSLPHLLAHINPAEKAARAKHPGARDDEIVRMTVVENVWQSVQELLAGSEELRELVIEGKLRVIGAMYDIQAGTVKILGRHPDEKRLLALPPAAAAHGEGAAPAH